MEQSYVSSLIVGRQRLWLTLEAPGRTPEGNKKAWSADWAGHIVSEMAASGVGSA